MLVKIISIVIFNFLILFEQYQCAWNSQNLSQDEAVHLENLYDTHIVQSEIDIENLCDLPKITKLAICDAVLQRLSNSIEIPAYNISYKIYFNKTAAHLMNPECIKRKLHFTESRHLNKKEMEQDMFPCYGRNKIPRTFWNIDDSYDLLYLSGGFTIEYTQFIVAYVHVKLADIDRYQIYKHIDIGDIDSLPEPQITDDDLQQESKLLTYLSYNRSIPQIESNYIREVVIPQKYDSSICKWSKPQKKVLCEIVAKLNNIDYQYDEAAFEQRTLKCFGKYIEFNFLSTTITDSKYGNIAFNMYQCPQISKSENRYYVATGYRPNSIGIFQMDLLKVTAYAHIENLIAESDPLENQDNTKNQEQTGDGNNEENITRSLFFLNPNDSAESFPYE